MTCKIAPGPQFQETVGLLWLLLLLSAKAINQ